MSKPSMPTVVQLLQWAVSYFKSNNNRLPQEHQGRLEAEVLLAFLLKVSRTKLLVESDQTLNSQLEKDFKALVEQRATGYPLQYITGVQNFMSLDLQVAEGVLIPRGDTEVLVEQALQVVKQLPAYKAAYRDGGDIGQPPLLIGDVCTGSGAIGLSLAHYLPQAQVILSDISPVAIQVAQANAQRLGLADRVAVVQGDLLQPIGEWLSSHGQGRKLRLLTANPPYISLKGFEETEEGVIRHEPMLALAGGVDGLDFYRQLADHASLVLEPEGYLLLEIGYDQGEAVRQLLRQQGAYQNIKVVKDYGHRDRVVMARLS